ncbi:hypothetical protein [Sphingomonas sp. PB4P5]|uniref:hypothetical protein n=1 Tax=Parasphingomonas puruogangriensis TaxID=3096155 RepID=UPI002FCA1804
MFAALVMVAPASSTPSADCYDVKINARIVEQIPSEAPVCDDCIIMRWPWFLDFQVKRTIEGDWRGKALTALSVQHTYLQSRYGIWLLRKNNLGGYNILISDDHMKPVRCPASTELAVAYLRPGPNLSLDEMRQAGERRYGQSPR